jgi:hypothetical protein
MFWTKFDRDKGEVNVFSWTDASYTAIAGSRDNYTIPDPFSFNFTLLHSPCEGFCPVYTADYGPFTGTNGSARLDLSSDAQEGRYRLQVYFFDAPTETVVVIGSSDNFTIGASQGDTFKPFDVYNSSQRIAVSCTVLSIVFVLFGTAFPLLMDVV